MSGGIAACDLDRTLIWSHRAGGRLDGEPAPHCVESRDGVSQSFVTMRASDFLERLADARALVPVTTRTVEQYRRVVLPGPPPRFVICLNGGRLLVDGEEHLGFASAVQRRLRDAAPYMEVRGQVERLLHDAGRVDWRLRDADGLFFYLVVENVPDSYSWLPPLRSIVGGASWEVSIQGRKIYCVPSTLTKASAVIDVLARTGDGQLLCAGDALLDGGMLALADVAWVPRGSELHRSGWSTPQARVTAAEGILAGEEIVAGMCEELGIAVAERGQA